MSLYIYKIILRGVFETELPHITANPNIPLFKNFQKIWNNIDNTNIISGIDDFE